MLNRKDTVGRLKKICITMIMILIAIVVLVYALSSPDRGYFWGMKNFETGNESGYKSAISNFKKAIYGEKIRFWKNHRQLPEYYDYLARSYSNLYQYDNAIEQFKNALEAYDRYEPEAVDSIALIKVQMAVVYSCQGSDEKVIHYGSQAAEYYKNTDTVPDAMTESSLYLWLANSYYNTHQYELASEYFELGIPLYYEAVNWGLGDELPVKMIAISYKMAAQTNEQLGNEERYEYYNEKYDKFVWLHSLTSADLDEIYNDFHWNK